MRWLKDIRVSKRNDNLAELQDITIERLNQRWRWEMFVTQRQRAAALKYHGLWFHARVMPPWRRKVPGNLRFPPVDEFSRAVRRDENLLAAAMFLSEWVLETGRKEIWMEAQASMGKHANLVDDVVRHGAQIPDDAGLGRDIEAFRAGLRLLDEHFSARRKLMAELKSLETEIDDFGNDLRDTGDQRVPERSRQPESEVA